MCPLCLSISTLQVSSSVLFSHSLFKHIQAIGYFLGGQSHRWFTFQSWSSCFLFCLLAFATEAPAYMHASVCRVRAHTLLLPQNSSLSRSHAAHSWLEFSPCQFSPACLAPWSWCSSPVTSQVLAGQVITVLSDALLTNQLPGLLHHLHITR